MQLEIHARDRQYQALMRALLDKYILDLHREGKTVEEIAASFDNREIKHPSQECNLIKFIIDRTIEREKLEARWRRKEQGS